MMDELMKTLEAGFEQGPVMVVVDTRVPGVHVPESLAGTINLKLNFSPRFDLHDLVMNEQGISQTLKFDGVNFPVIVPWAAVLAYRFQNGDHGLCLERMPVEIQERFVMSVFAPFEQQERKPVVTKKPTLKVVH